ncbi:hypothetical protein [Stenotrophomonas bentonitica]|uniref:hypothetical protein n=1 Tax=Stenotrophomonas bentonitica TaxID=1450134 RepID=UPI000C9D1202|nr:hypothetical protein [Stenotrophomonas bentonitica]
MNTERTEKFVNAIACDLEEGGFRQVSGTTLRRTLATAVSAALPLLADTGIPASQPAELAEQQGVSGEWGGSEYYRRLLLKAVEMLTQISLRLGLEPNSDGVEPMLAAIDALAATGKQQVGEVQGDARAQFEVWWAEKNADLVGVQLARDEETEIQRNKAARLACWLAAWQAALAARQPVAQEPVGFQIMRRSADDTCFNGRWDNPPLDREYYLSRPGTYRIRDIYTAPPAQGIDPGQLRGWLCATTDGVATDWTMEEDSRARFERMGRTIEPVFAAGPDVQGTRQDHLLDRRNRLMNSYGNGDREDAAVDAQIAQVDAELALIAQRDAAPGVGS